MDGGGCLQGHHLPYRPALCHKSYVLYTLRRDQMPRSRQKLRELSLVPEILALCLRLLVLYCNRVVVSSIILSVSLKAVLLPANSML